MPPIDYAGHVAGIDSRVTGLEINFKSLDANFRSFAADTKGEFAALRQDTAAQLSQITAALNGLGGKMEASGKTPWQLIISAAAVSITMLGGLGFMMKQPIDSAISRLAADVGALSHDVVPRAEHERIWADSRDRERVLAEAVVRTQTTTLSKGETEIYAKLRDEQIGDLKRRLERLEQGH